MNHNHPTAQIRTANQNDADAIVGLCQQFGYSVESEMVIQTLEKISTDLNQQVFAAVDGQTVVAWIHVFIADRIESESFAEIGGVVVDQNYRQRGIGAALVAKVSEWAKTQGYRKLRVRCADQRKSAHDFYLAQGMSKTKTQYIFDKTLR